MQNIFNRKNLLITLILLIPFWIFLGGHYSLDTKITGTLPTGFFNGEAPYYMANARQYVDHGFNHLFYGNPFSYLAEGERVYFQFQTYFLAILYKLTGNINFVWQFFGILVTVLFVCCGIQLLKEMHVPKKYLFLTSFLMIWGGGIQSITGFLSEFLHTFNLIEGIKAFEKFEIADGWWMQSIGRNFLMPNYTYYHLLVMLGFLFIKLKRHRELYFLGFVLSFSHPFVGAQFLSGVFVWTLFERYYLNSIESNYFSFKWIFALLLMHLGYYFGFLNISSEHVLQAAQWDVRPEDLYKNWAMQAKNFIPTYIVVFGLAFYQIRNTKYFTRFFQDHFNRFLAILGVSNFILANHEFAIKPIQPIHFTHGMVWMPFFLLGVQTIVYLFKKFFKDKIFTKILVGLFILIFVSDNLLWMAKRTYQTHLGKSQTEVNLTVSQKAVIDFIEKSIVNSHLFFVEDLNLGYHLAVYTNARVFASHHIITPDSKNRKELQDQVIQYGKLPKNVKEDLYYIISSSPVRNKNLNKLIFENAAYKIYEMKN